MTRNPPQNKLFSSPHHDAVWHASPHSTTLRRCCYPARLSPARRLGGAVFRINPRLVHHQSGRSFELLHFFTISGITVNRPQSRDHLSNRDVKDQLSCKDSFCPVPTMLSRHPCFNHTNTSNCSFNIRYPWLWNVHSSCHFGVILSSQAIPQGDPTSKYAAIWKSDITVER